MFARVHSQDGRMIEIGWIDKSFGDVFFQLEFVIRRVVFRDMFGVEAYREVRKAKGEMVEFNDLTKKE